MNESLQAALTTLASVYALYMILNVARVGITLFFDIQAQFNRKKDLELFAQSIGSSLLAKDQNAAEKLKEEAEQYKPNDDNGLSD